MSTPRRNTPASQARGAAAASYTTPNDPQERNASAGITGARCSSRASFEAVMRLKPGTSNIVKHGSDASLGLGPLDCSQRARSEASWLGDKRIVDLQMHCDPFYNNDNSRADSNSQPLGPEAGALTTKRKGDGKDRKLRNNSKEKTNVVFHYSLPLFLAKVQADVCRVCIIRMCYYLYHPITFPTHDNGIVLSDPNLTTSESGNSFSKANILLSGSRCLVRWRGHKIGGMSGLEPGTLSSESRTLLLRHTTPQPSVRLSACPCTGPENSLAPRLANTLTCDQTEHVVATGRSACLPARNAASIEELVCILALPTAWHPGYNGETFGHHVLATMPDHAALYRHFVSLSDSPLIL
ncbi:hypothetical protein Bbelb_007730 [Branchiostoma belcheri]|nr:hypothetical protein Bbelb_007730 [Branchiostoma belcheri]